MGMNVELFVVVVVKNSNVRCHLLYSSAADGTIRIGSERGSVGISAVLLLRGASCVLPALKIYAKLN